MAEKKSSRKGRTNEPTKAEETKPAADEAEAPVEKEEPKTEAPVEKEKPKKAPTSRVALVTFDRWFNAMVQKGKYKPHHKAGMSVWLGKVKGRRSVEEWNKLFEKY